MLLWAKRAGPPWVKSAVWQVFLLPGGPAKQETSWAPPGTVVWMDSCLINGFSKPLASQKNSS